MLCALQPAWLFLSLQWLRDLGVRCSSGAQLVAAVQALTESAAQHRSALREYLAREDGTLFYQTPTVSGELANLNVCALLKLNQTVRRERR